MAISGASGTGSMRPRANTISHVDNVALSLLSNNSADENIHDSVGLGINHSALGGLPGVAGYQFRGMSNSSGHHGHPHVLPKLETRHHHLDVGGSLRTAPVFGQFGNGIDSSHAWSQPGSTINPAQLHFANSPHHFSFDSPQSPFGHIFPAVLPNHGNFDGDGNFPWLSNFENHMSFNEYAIETSTPSDSGGSPDAMGDMVFDSSTNPPGTSEPWQPPAMSQAPLGTNFALDPSSAPLPDFYSMGQISPKSAGAPFGVEQFYPTPPTLPSQPAPSLYPGIGHHIYPGATIPKPETPSNSAASVSSSNRLSSTTSFSTDSITDVTRNTLLTSLSQQSLHGYHNLKTSQPRGPSPASPETSMTAGSVASVPLPSTLELRRYVGAYFQYFHPHLPFLHVASLSFDSPVFTDILHASNGQSEYGQPPIAGGGGALILAMAAIGALYEYDFGPSRELFDMSRTMIRIYTTERRKAEVTAAPNSSFQSADNDDTVTPLWLVQAMLLNVIYGHNCGDKIAAGIASTLCGTVINLARSAKLVHPRSEDVNPLGRSSEYKDVEMTNDGTSPRHWSDFSPFGTGNTQNEWLHWKQEEERKRTLFAVFILSSLLVSAYNHPPALMNSEIRLDLPCDENLWAAETPEIWKSMGGSAFNHEIPFATALTSLLTAHQRDQGRPVTINSDLGNGGISLDNLPPADFKPSTFGSLVLINALHDYIWETRQRHVGMEWTAQETEAMHARIEPALRSWQAAWSLNPEHSMERPNPFGANSLSADCIPLLDLAYLRLFVNLGRSKEAFFQRDWDAMADELAYGDEIVQHADTSLDTTSGIQEVTASSPMVATSPNTNGSTAAENVTIPSAAQGSPNTRASKRERHLRKAAFYAANSLTLSDRLGVTFADFNSRELPLQSALCAFDCAQVLAEWISTLQQRVGSHLGVLGRDAIDYSELPALLFLEQEDRDLMGKIDGILKSLTLKLNSSETEEAPVVGPTVDECGYGGRILLVHARMFERASIWPCK